MCEPASGPPLDAPSATAAAVTPFTERLANTTLPAHSVHRASVVVVMLML
jgi:hypothetical protein